MKKPERFQFLAEGVDLVSKSIYYSGAVESDFLSLIRTATEFILDSKAKEINLFIDSVGGDLPAILATIDYFNELKKQRKVKVNIIAEGRCYSATLLLLACATGKRYARPETIFMFHKVQSVLPAEYNAINDEIEEIVKKKLENCIGFTKMVSIITKEKPNYFFLVDEAYDYGIIDYKHSKIM